MAVKKIYSRFIEKKSNFHNVISKNVDFDYIFDLFSLTFIPVKPSKPQK